jgi:beta-aspartyl-dipeptidase (metallo-type)
LFTLVKRVHVFQPEDLGIKDILICNDKIAEIGDDLDFGLPNQNCIDGTGMLAIPGYLDQHVHVTGGGGEGSFKTRVPELKLSDCIKAGVTTVVGLLGTDGITRSVENLVAKTKGLNEEGITAYCLTGSYEYPTRTLTGDVKKDIAFIQEVLGVKIAISDHRSSHITKDELTRLASSVRQASLISGKPGIIVFHLGSEKEQLNLIFQVLRDTDIPVKHFRPTHAQKAFDQAIKFANMGGYVDFTAGDDPGSADPVLTALGSANDPSLITISTDSNGSMPRWNDKNEMIGLTAGVMTTLHGTIKALVKEHGVDMPTAISLGTRNVARALEIGDRKGSLGPGLDADIVLLDKSFDISTVIAKGRLMMHQGEILVKGTFQR